jgi:undecaprenyl-diphosphatase
MYGGILLLVASRFHSTAVRVLTVVLGIAIPLFVGWARMYRGMHHLSDVAAGLLMGLGALTILVFAARASRAASERRDGEPVGGERIA